MIDTLTGFKLEFHTMIVTLSNIKQNYTKIIINYEFSFQFAS